MYRIRQSVINFNIPFNPLIMINSHFERLLHLIFRDSINLHMFSLRDLLQLIDEDPANIPEKVQPVNDILL